MTKIKHFARSRSQRIGLKIVRFGYVFIFKPIIILFLPDKVHEAMVGFSKWFGSYQFLRKFAIWLYDDVRDKRLVQKIHGIEFISPIGLAAGFDKNAEIIPAISTLGFGFQTVGSVTAEPCAGNPRPWFYRLPREQSLIINVGFANHGSKVVIDRISKISKRFIDKLPIVLSIAQTNGPTVSNEGSGINDYVTSVRRAKLEKNISMIELNIECPNNFGGESFTTPKRLERLLAAIDAVKTQKPIFLKFPADLSWPKAELLLDIAIKHRVAGVTVSYLSKNRTKSDLHDETVNSIEGDLSGKSIRWLSNELIRLIYKKYGDRLIIIGAGGVLSADDAYTKIKFGATLVEFVTGLILNGPQLAAEINEDLSKLLEQDGYDNVSQARGADIINL